jgi:acyl carrier protein
MTEWTGEFEQILRQHCRFLDDAEPIDADASLPDLGINSISMLSILMAIEDTFAVSLPDLVVTGDEFGTPGGMWRTIAHLMADQHSSIDA